jgi:hypothetical protein
MKWIILFFTFSAFAQIPQSLEETSSKINRDLPEVYDHITKLRSTTAENNNLVYNFLVDVNQKEYQWAMPKVKAQVLSTICSKGRERMVLHVHNANIVYRYENVKGQSLGEFMIRPEHCPKR